MSDFTLNAASRELVGKGSSRRLRRLEGLVPAIIYGGKAEPQQISLKHNELVRMLDEESFYSSVVNLNVDGQSETVILKDLQRHPAKAQILHADFMRVDANTAIVVSVPLHYVNEDTCVGVKLQSGSIQHEANEVEVRCLPGALPEYIEVDMLEVEAGQTLHISDIKLPEGVESTQLALGEDHDQPIVSVKKPGGQQADDSAEGGEESAE